MFNSVMGFSFDCRQLLLKMVWLILLVSDAVRTLPVLVKTLASQKLMLLSLLLFTEEKSSCATNCK